MTPRFGLTFTAAAMLLAGCGTSIDPAAKADIDTRIAGLRPQTITIPVPASDAVYSIAPAVGQWAQYKLTQTNGQPNFLTQKIVGEEGGALLVEIVDEGYQGRRVEQLLVAVGDTKDPKQVELRAVKIKDERGRLINLSRMDLWVARKHMGPANIYWEDALAVALVNDWQGVPQASTTVIAGRFEGCYHTKASNSMISEETWSHPSVPLGGLVRREMNRGFVSELVAYGITGAQSDL